MRRRTTLAIAAGDQGVSRRDVLASGAALAVAGLLGGEPRAAAQAGHDTVRSRPIPRSGESLPVVGVGTAIVFDVGDDAQKRAGCAGVVRALVDGGGSIVDTAPSYGTAETVIGGILADTGLRQRIFLATKLEHYGDGSEADQVRASM